MFLFIVFFLSISGAAQKSDPVDVFVGTKMQEMHIPGLSLAVVKNGKVIKAAGYGIANLETGTSATPETMYNTASLSKSVIAAAVVLLAQDGKISLDDKVNKYLEDPPDTWSQITIRHLLSHTSGIVRDPADYHPYENRPITAVIKDCYSLPLAFPPGEQWLYSNVGYYLLAEVITKASGKPWDAFIAERLFVPAQMKSARLATVTDIVPHRAGGYHYSKTGMENAENWIAIRPSSAFLSTVLDLAKWDTFLDSSPLLSSASRKLIWTPVTLNNRTSVDYGFGWYVDALFGHPRIHHDGQYPGFRSDYERFMDEKLTVIILANSDNDSVETLAIKIAGFYEPSLTLPPFTLTAAVSNQTIASGKAVNVAINATDEGHHAPGTLLEMEIWNAREQAVYKDHRENENFATGQTKTYTFVWTPAEPGVYTVNIGAYGPKWMPSVAWKEHAATITVAP